MVEHFYVMFGDLAASVCGGISCG